MIAIARVPVIAIARALVIAIERVLVVAIERVLVIAVQVAIKHLDRGCYQLVAIHCYPWRQCPPPAPVADLPPGWATASVGGETYYYITDAQGIVTSQWARPGNMTALPPPPTRS